MYVGKKYTATQTAHQELEYCCRHCGHTVDVVVIGVGMGQAQSPFFLDNQGAAGRAETRALDDAGKNAELTLKLWPCPACKKRDGTGFIVESAIALAASAGLFLGLGFLVSSLEMGGPAWMFWIGAVLSPVLLFHYGIQWKWTTAKDRVIPVEDLEKKLAEAAAAEAKPRRTAEHRAKRRAKARAAEEAREAEDGEEERAVAEAAAAPARRRRRPKPSDEGGEP